ncbi:MAG: MFS transporter [Kutzneria sp.]|nr:MFS transporter [Kutzneria sp.]MBV9844706.1 MFS transporter [Kutzneria sp.]
MNHERLRGWGPFGAGSFALLALLIGSNLPTPLFPLYSKVYGLSSLVVTLLFATYALTVIPALLIFGPLSDAKGRREVLTAAIIVAAVAALLFAMATEVAVLFVAQVVQAIALGALQGTAAPTLVEYDPSGQRRRASATASALTVAGAAFGPLLAGVLAQYAPLPQRLTYLVEVALLVVALVAVLAFLPRRRDPQPWRPRRPSVPSGIRRPFVVAGISTFVAWAVTGLFLSLIPSFVISELHHDNLALAGAVVALMLGLAAVVQVTGRRIGSLSAQMVGLVVMIAGVAVLIAADLTMTLSALLVAAALAGIGQGLAFMGSLGDVNQIAPENRRGDVVASYYVVVYVGTALPAIGVGVVAQLASLPTAIEIFSYAVVVICLAGLAGLVMEAQSRRVRSDPALDRG